MLYYVNLGLPSGTKWASCNLYANEPHKKGFSASFNFAKSHENITLPTIEQWKELMKECSWKWKGNGYEVVGKNGNNIFLPAAGREFSASIEGDGYRGYYWSSSKDDRNIAINPLEICAECVYFDSHKFNRTIADIHDRMSVRPVLNN